MNFLDIYRLLLKKRGSYQLQKAHSSQISIFTLNKIAHMLGHKTNLNKFQVIKIIRSIFFELSEIEISN